MPDLLAWFIYWFLAERYVDAEKLLAEFTMLNAWADRMRALGYGTSSAMTPAEALAIAKDSTPLTEEQSDAHDPQGLKPGMKVSITPTIDSGETAIEGLVRAVNRDTIALTIENPLCGEVAVHFPRVGNRVSVL
jgi:glutathione S-transferase